MATSLNRAELLFRLRNMVGLTQQQVADMVSVVLRTVALWEAGTQPMPDARWELFTLKVARLIDQRPELVVIVDADGTSVLDVVADAGYFDHVNNGDGTAVISSFAMDRLSGRPTLHSQRFRIAANKHVLEKAEAWKAMQDRSATAGDAAQVVMHRWLARRVLGAEARNPKLREMKDAISAASHAVEEASNAPEEIRREKLTALDQAIFALIKETS